jgi:hypothetical protein
MFLVVIHFVNHTLQVEMRRILRVSFLAKRASKKERLKSFHFIDRIVTSLSPSIAMPVRQ